MRAPPANWNRLQKMVWTMREHGNEAEHLNLETLASHNRWTTADELLAEFRLQENGSRKLPEEAAASCPPAPTTEEIEE